MSKITEGLLKGSLVLLISFNIFNVLNFLYHLVMARILSVAEYGALASILSIFVLMSMPSDAVQNTITKYATLNKNSGKLKNILKRSLKRTFRYSFLIFVLYAIAAYPLSIYLDIGYFALATSGLMIFASFLNPVTRGILLGEKKFNSLGMNMVIEGAFKILLGALFVLFFTAVGLVIFRLHGAILGAIAGAFLAFLISFVSIKNVLFAKEEKANVKEIYGYARPAFLVTLALAAFIGLDVIIARAVFDPNTAGAYAIASILAKVIYFGTSPISRAVFPISSAQANNKKNSSRILLQALWLVLGLIAISLIVLALFPKLLILIFSGKELPLAEEVLFYLGLAASVVSVANLFLIYRLSLGQIKNSFVLLFFLIVEIVLLFVFSQTIVSFSLAFLSAAIIFLIGAIIITLHE